MILKEEDIKNILNRKSTVVSNRMLGINLNQYEYTSKELLNLVQTYIYEKKGINIGEIQEPKGNLCHSFLKIMVSKGIMDIDKCSDFNALDVASNISLNYFSNKLKE